MKTFSMTLLLAVLIGQAVVSAKEISAEGFEGLPNAVVYSEGVLGGGAPTAEALAEAKKRGVGIVVDLRLEDDKTTEEARVVEDLGMSYHRIPVAGPSSITEKELGELDHILSNRGDQGVLLHCASGRRSGALWQAYEQKFKSGAAA